MHAESTIALATLAGEVSDSRVRFNRMDTEPIVKVPESVMSLRILAGDYYTDFPNISGHRPDGLLMRYQGEWYIWDNSVHAGKSWRRVRIVKGV